VRCDLPATAEKQEDTQASQKHGVWLGDEVISHLVQVQIISTLANVEYAVQSIREARYNEHELIGREIRHWRNDWRSQKVSIPDQDWRGRVLTAN
jgi:hypothetical protein